MFQGDGLDRIDREILDNVVTRRGIDRTVGALADLCYAIAKAHNNARDKRFWKHAGFRLHIARVIITNEEAAKEWQIINEVLPTPQPG